MSDREKLIESMTDKAVVTDLIQSAVGGCAKHWAEIIADFLLANGIALAKDTDVPSKKPRSLEEWGEDYGDVLWWAFPIEEPPYVGSPLDEKWPGYHTHWTPIVVPDPPKEGR